MNLLPRRAACLPSLALAVLAMSNHAGAQTVANHGPFPDFQYLPANYSGEVFHLRQDYPPKEPVASQQPAVLKIDFKTDWKKYMLELRKYCFEGNIDPAVDWKVERNKVRNWYHMPWQHWGPDGREGIHGLTKEAPVQPKQLAETQTYEGGQTYAVGFYNEFGGYTIGQVWRNQAPDPSVTAVKGGGFPAGTVVCKLLFVDVPVAEVPSLGKAEECIQWMGYITDKYESQNRSYRELTLIQMDVMVKDPRSDTGWVFGTFQYNSAVPAQNHWDRLVPVGIQWGNDPKVEDSSYQSTDLKQTRINPNIKESIINPDPELPPTHLGWNGRLNGPVDNPRSSCMSCHQTASYPQKTPMSPLFLPAKLVPKVSSPKWMSWFQNLTCGEPIDIGTLSCDGSLQMALAIQNYYSWQDSRGGQMAATFDATPRVRVANGAPTRDSEATIDVNKPFPIIRDVPHPK